MTISLQSADCADAFPYFDCIMQPPLSRIEIRMPSGAISLAMASTLFEMISLRCPHLQTVIFSATNSNGEVTTPEGFDADLSESICRLKSLRGVHFFKQYIVAEAIQHLANQQHLQALSLFLPDPTQNGTPFDPTLYSTDDGGFPSLQDLKITATAWGPICSTLPNISRPLASMELLIRSTSHRPRAIHESDQRYAEVALTLSKNTGQHHSLTRLYILDDIFFLDYTITDQARLTSALEGLLDLQSLEYLRLELAGAEELTDAWLRRCAISWPRMRKFSLLGHAHMPAKRMTLEGLLPLIEQWPDLCEIDIPLIWKPFDISILPSAACNRHIKTLPRRWSTPVWPWTESLVHQVSECLFAIFPMLESIPLGDRLHQLSYGDEGWAALNTLVKQHHDIVQASEQTTLN
jgi:hypothetical protein